MKTKEVNVTYVQEVGGGSLTTVYKNGVYDRGKLYHDRWGTLYLDTEEIFTVLKKLFLAEAAEREEVEDERRNKVDS